MSLLFATLSLLVPQSPSTAPVVINEFVHDDAGVTDDREFVELWNRTGAPIDISGWQLQGEEGSAGGLPNGVFVFPPGTMLAPGQYLVVGQAAVPNVNFVTTNTTPAEWLGENVAGSANAPDGLTLRNAAGTVIDAVAWNFAVWTATVPNWVEGSGIWGAMQMIDGASQPPQGYLSAQRWTDGQDTNDNGHDFVHMIWTPGAPNGAANTLVPAILENCDGAVGSDLNALFGFSFVPATIQDPAAVVMATGAVPRVFPPSPQGGNVARMIDPSGGGNMVTAQVLNLLNDLLLECWVYVMPGNAALATGEGESWAIGVRGTTDSFAHPVDASGTYYAQASLCNNRSPGATGVAWMAYVGAAQTDLYLVDANDGGPGVTVLAGPITANASQNSGWQRLRLRIQGQSLVANFGGTFGADDGQRFTATVAPSQGTVWMQYRECIVANANISGLIVDRVEIWSPLAAGASFSGQGSPTSVGTPQIATVGQPQVGNAGFQITGASMIPGGISLLALDVGVLLPGVPVPGAPPSLLLYASPTFIGAVLNTPGGTSTFPFPVPPANVLAGTNVAAQWFDLDVTLPFALPFGSSRGCQLLLGN